MSPNQISGNVTKHARLHHSCKHATYAKYFKYISTCRIHRILMKQWLLRNGEQVAFIGEFFNIIEEVYCGHW